MNNEPKYLRFSEGNTWSSRMEYREIVGETKTQWRLKDYRNIPKSHGTVISVIEYSKAMQAIKESNRHRDLATKFKFRTDWHEYSLSQLLEIQELIKSFQIIKSFKNDE